MNPEVTSYTIEQLAQRWQCAYLTVYEMIHEQKIQAFKVGRGWRIPVQAVIDYENN